jgi:tetratricopeptide (TPR) repeat protein
VDLVHMVAPTRSQRVAVLQAAGNWPAAAFQLWEEGRLAEAADLYKEHRLYYKAAILYRQAQDLRNAADAFAKDVHHTPSWRAAAHLYQQLGELRQAATQHERLKEWDAAACLWEQAGDRMRAAAIYANQLGERRKASALYKEALEEFVRLHDYVGQADCLRKLEEWQQAAVLCLGQAQQREGPHLDDAARAEVVRWYKDAANCFRNSGQRHDFLECCKKARFYGRLPWLTLSFKVDKPLRCGASNLVSVVVANEGAGTAREVVVSLQHAGGCVRFSNFQPIDILGPQQNEVRRAELRADEHGDLLVRVFVQWNDPDQRRREVQFPEWHAVIESPEGRHSSQTTVYVQGGTFIQGSEIYNGDVYRDQAQQTGDRVGIVRNTAPAVQSG